MNFRTFLNILILAVFFSSCDSNYEDKLENIEGYWEIKEVQKDNRLIKEYNISLSIDYFEVNDDLTGFRKKVSPTLNNSFIITKDQAPFTLKIENDSLNIYYNHNEVITKETIVNATNESLIIENSQGFRYIYKPFKSINIDQ